MLPIRISEDTYRKLMEMSPNWLSLCDSHARVLSINRVGLQALGLTEEEAIGRPFHFLWPSNLYSEIQTAVSRVLEGDTYLFDAELQSPIDGSTFWHVALAPITTNLNERVEKFAMVAVDVTCRRRAENIVRETEERYVSIFESLSDVYLRCQPDGTINKISSSVQELLGYEASELTGIRCPHIFANRSEAIALFHKIVNEGEIKDYCIQLLSKDGSIRDVSISASVVKSESGRPIYTEGVIRDITERINAERALRISEDRLELTLEAVNDGLWDWNLNDNSLYVSPKYCTMLGYEPEEFAPTFEQFAKLVHPDDYEVAVTMKRQRALGLDTTHSIEFRMKTKSGDWCWIQSRGKVVERDAQGNPIRVLGTHTDITARKQVEESLGIYKLLSDNAQDIMLFVREDDRIMEANEAAVHAYGYPKAELLSKLFSDLRSKSENTVATLELGELGGSGMLYENMHCRRDGSTFPVEVSLQIALINGERIILAIVRDITERKRAERDLLLQTSAMNAAGDQIVITDTEGRIQFVNPAFERETGYSVADVLGTVLKLTRPGRRQSTCYSNIWTSVSSGETWHGEVVSHRKDQSLYTEEVTITPVCNQYGNIEHCIAIKRNITEKKIYQARLDQLAHHDHLTGLPNRLMFSDELTRRLDDARKKRLTSTVMFLDLDRFKMINDTLGHNVGDKLLREAADRMKACLRTADNLARMGGDEFTVILPTIRCRDEAALIAQNILDSLAKPFVLDEHELFVTASIGMSIFPEHGSDVETLVKNADTAMYRAKERGRNTYQFYDESFNAVAVERMTVETSLRKALAKKEFLTYFQPQIDLSTREILGAEALVRWESPEHGMVMPNDFIPISEETGLIVPLSHWVLRNACMQAKSWADAGLPAMKVAVNISARLLEQDGLVATVSRTLTETGLNPHMLELELTESALMINPELAARLLKILKNMGVRISIDDFGTGYSSLGRLKQLPIDTLKIDKSFICDIPRDSDDAAIAEAIVAMAHSLKLKVIAEGVETIEQIDYLTSIGCDGIQGYFLSQPMPGNEFVRMLKRASDDPMAQFLAA